MGIYENRILPWLIDRACSIGPVMQLRQQVVPGCEGTVLEIGAGSGINFALYDAERVQQVIALEPSAGMRRQAGRRPPTAGAIPTRWLELPGEQIPLADRSVDTVLLTFTLCSIADWQAALRQMHRVLKPGGQLLYCEHGRAPDAKVQAMQDRLTPLWRRLAGGCHLNRPIVDYITQAGFELATENSLYLQNVPRFAGYVSHGRAIKSS